MESSDITILLLQQIGNMTHWYSFSCHGITAPYLLKGMLLNHVKYVQSNSLKEKK
jgi:hypothetical protein